MTKAGQLLARYKKLHEEEMEGLPPIPTSQDMDITSDGSDNTPDVEALLPFGQDMGDMSMDGMGDDAEEDEEFEDDEMTDDDDMFDDDEEMP